jgi:hypothetical protein
MPNEESEGSWRQIIAPRHTNLMRQVKLDKVAERAKIQSTKRLNVYMRWGHDEKDNALTRGDPIRAQGQSLLNERRAAPPDRKSAEVVVLARGRTEYLTALFKERVRWRDNERRKLGNQPSGNRKW